MYSLFKTYRASGLMIIYSFYQSTRSLNSDFDLYRGLRFIFTRHPISKFDKKIEKFVLLASSFFQWIITFITVCEDNNWRHELTVWHFNNFSTGKFFNSIIYLLVICSIPCPLREFFTHLQDLYWRQRFLSSGFPSSVGFKFCFKIPNLFDKLVPIPFQTQSVVNDPYTDMDLCRIYLRCENHHLFFFIINTIRPICSKLFKMRNLILLLIELVFSRGHHEGVDPNCP